MDSNSPAPSPSSASAVPPRLNRSGHQRLPESLVRTHGDARAARRSRIWVPVVAVALLAFSVFNVYLNLNQEQLPSEVEGVAIFGTIPGGVVDGPVQYDQLPPVGGPHAELAHLCGLYRVPLTDEHAVKSLATGAVWIAYDPDLPAADVDALRSAASGNLDVLVAPYPGLQHPVVLTAWERQLALDRVDDPRIEFFIHIYQNSERAPDVEESCSIGVGPISH
jgi:hypothetical protein